MGLKSELVSWPGSLRYKPNITQTMVWMMSKKTPKQMEFRLTLGFSPYINFEYNPDIYPE